MTARAEWLSAILRQARELGPIPRYGDPEWEALAQGDPRFVAAVVVAAECWHVESDPATIAERLTLEVAAARQAEQQLQQEDWAQMASSLRATAGSPSHDELARRRRGGAS